MLPINMNGHVIGIILKELVRRAMMEIRRQRLVFEATPKEGYGGDMNDILTSADTAAQAIYERTIREALPGVGIIGEEGLRVPCSIPDRNVYITIDPLDGTKAFVRQQSHGVSTMVAMVVDGEIVSAWIGDINTMEIFGYRPGSEKVHRIHELSVAQDLTKINRAVTVADEYVLLRDPPEGFPPSVRAAVGRFKAYQIDGGSIGTWFARLWKGECHGLVMSPSHETPWDTTPCLGISYRLGFQFLTDFGGGWVHFQSPLKPQVYKRQYYQLVVHAQVAGQFLGR